MSDKSEKAPPVETLWREHISKDKNIGYTLDEEGNPIVYQWKAWHWEVLNKTKTEKIIEQFIITNRPGEYNSRTLGSCYRLTDSIIMNTRTPLAEPDFQMIVTQGHVVEVESSGRLVVYPIKPDGSYIVEKGTIKKFITKAYVPIALDKSRISKASDGKLVYTPRGNEATESGLWGRLIRTTITNEALRGQFQEFFGDMFTTIQRKAFVVLVGEADSGKSQILTVGRHLMPSPATMDLENTGGFSLTGIIGSHAVFIDELPKRMSNESIFKRLVGGAMISIPRHYKSPLSIVPKNKFMAGANEIMSAAEKSDAIMTRLRVFPCDWCPPEHRVEEIGEKISKGYTCAETGDFVENELDKVFDWSLVGLSRIMQRGRALGRDELETSSREYTQKLEEVANPVLVWMQDWELREAVNGTYISKKELLRVFRIWADENGHGRLSNVSSQVFFRDFFFRATDKLWGRGWDGDREKPQKMACTDGTRQYCLPVAMLNASARVDYAKKSGKDFSHMHVVPTVKATPQPQPTPQPLENEPTDEWGVPLSQTKTIRR